MPKTPIYTALLTDAARAVMGVPHPSGRAALKMLEAEGFEFDGYVDIFDGGPTVSAHTDEIRTVRESRHEMVAAIGEPEGAQTMLLAAGNLSNFTACYGRVHVAPGGVVTLDPGSAAMLGVDIGDGFLAGRR